VKKGDSAIAGVTMLGEAGTTGTELAHLHIAKSYVDSDSASGNGYDSKGTYGEKLEDNQYIHYIAIGDEENPASRAYVIPPTPITPPIQE
jgi:hypothetical protein